jgi:arylsulfatase
MWPVGFDGKPVTDTSNWRIRVVPLPLLDGDRQVAAIRTLDQQDTLTASFTRKAEEFIRGNRHRPFFLYLAHPMPHVPLAVSPAFRGRSGAGLYADVMMELDWSLGRIMDVLDSTGLSGNTLLIVTSDNGPWLSYGNHAGSSGGLREGKGTAWDGGTRVPCLIRWTGKIKAGSLSSELLTNMDLLPTVVSAANASLPKKRIDGLNFLPLLSGDTACSPREVFYVYYDQNSLKLVRYKNWELVLPHRSQSYIRNAQGKDGFPGNVPVVDVPMALYNLSHDPGTVYDVQHYYPDVVKKIMSFVEEAREDLGDDLSNMKGKNTREPAKLQ